MSQLNSLAHTKASPAFLWWVGGRDGNEMQRRRKKEGIFHLPPAGTFTTAVHRWVQTQVCSPKAKGGKRGRREQNLSKKNAVNSPYCLWRDCAHTPTQLAHNDKKPKDSNTEV